jgi:hypothetical protein
MKKSPKDAIKEALKYPNGWIYESFKDKEEGPLNHSWFECQLLVIDTTFLMSFLTLLLKDIKKGYFSQLFYSNEDKR